MGPQLKKKEGIAAMSQTEKLRDALITLVQAAEESLLYGQHDGECDNNPDNPDSGPCYQHIAASERRHQALERAIQKAKTELC